MNLADASSPVFLIFAAAALLFKVSLQRLPGI
jgi:hypothetical protein